MRGHLPPGSSPYAQDDGRPDPALAAVLTAHARGEADRRAVQHALLGARLLLPVVTAPGEPAAPAAHAASADSAAHGPAERTAELSGVLVEAPDGRRGVPVFTGLPALAAWDPSARPSPLPAQEAARGAYDQEAVALLVDPAGPVRAAITGAALLALAEDRQWLVPAEDPDVVAAVRTALDGLPAMLDVDVTEGSEADLLVTLHLDPAATREEVVGSARDAGDRLAGSVLLRARLERGLDVAVA